ncbi:MAG TPA: response regulator, partial [Polyangiales bacterium]|nr:response regulator [Polyangiales bacterium]
PEFLPSLFERFRQADSSKTRKFGGLGLGLAIVRQLVELHGGHVDAFSDGVGAGARFVIELPLQSELAAEDAQPGSLSRLSVAPPETGLAGVHVFVVEDELDAREFLVMLLNQEHAYVRSAGSVAEALRALAEEPCDVLVSDIGLPEEDGYALIRRLRARKDGLARVPAIALTAYARESDRKDALNAGFNVHLAKPVDLTRLLTTIRSLLSEGLQRH